MNYVKSVITSCVLVSGLLSCQSKKPEPASAVKQFPKSRKDSVQYYKDSAGNQIVSAPDVSDKGVKAVIKDSTLLLRYAELLQLLPELTGYKKSGIPSGEAYAARTSGGMQSYIRQDYIDGKGKELQLEIVDYNLSKPVLEGLLKMYERNSAVPDQASGLHKLSQLPIPARVSASYYSFNAESKRSSLIYAIGNRYLLLINGLNLPADSGQLIRIARQVPYAKLK